MELIERKAMLKKIESMTPEQFYKFFTDVCGAYLKQNAAPVVHGQWIECDDDIYTWIECSKCGFEQDIDDCGEHPHEAEDYMLCPACGARMNGGKDDG